MWMNPMQDAQKRVIMLQIFYGLGAATNAGPHTGTPTQKITIRARPAAVIMDGSRMTTTHATIFQGCGRTRLPISAGSARRRK